MWVDRICYLGCLSRTFTHCVSTAHVFHIFEHVLAASITAFISSGLRATNTKRGLAIAPRVHLSDTTLDDHILHTRLPRDMVRPKTDPREVSPSRYIRNINYRDRQNDDQRNAKEKYVHSVPPIFFHGADPRAESIEMEKAQTSS